MHLRDRYLQGQIRSYEVATLDQIDRWLGWLQRRRAGAMYGQRRRIDADIELLLDRRLAMTARDAR